MTRAIQQKLTERRHVEKVLKAMELSSLNLIDGTEPPDFELNNNGKKVYIEHTELINWSGSKSRSRKASLRKMLKEIKEEFISQYPDTLVSVELEFAHQINLKGQKQKQLKEQLIRICLNQIPNDQQFYVKLESEHLPDGVEQMIIASHGFVEETHWFFMEVHLYGEVREPEFTRRVSKKNIDILKARVQAEYSEFWLVLQTGEEFASYAGMDVKSEFFNSDWVFDKIILYDSFDPTSKNPIQVYQKQEGNYTQLDYPSMS